MRTHTHTATHTCKYTHKHLPHPYTRCTYTQTDSHKDTHRHTHKCNPDLQLVSQIRYFLYLFMIASRFILFRTANQPNTTPVARNAAESSAQRVKSLTPAQSSLSTVSSSRAATRRQRARRTGLVLGSHSTSCRELYVFSLNISSVSLRFRRVLF